MTDEHDDGHNGEQLTLFEIKRSTEHPHIEGDT